MTTHNKYTVHQRLSDITSRVTELEADNKRLRVQLKAELLTAINDSANVIQSSIRVPQDGVDGRDGVDGVSIKGDTGDRGPAGDVLIPNETELQQAVIAVRAELLRYRAQVIGRIVQGIEDNKNSNKVQQHFARLLEYVKKDIENLS